MGRLVGVDARLTSMLILFFMYLGLIALWRAVDEPARAARVTAITILVGVVNIPIIKFSVDWWNTLHQGQSIGLTGSSIDGALLWPLPITLSGFTLLFAAIVLMRMRTLLAQAKAEARMRRMARA